MQGQLGTDVGVLTVERGKAAFAFLLLPYLLSGEFPQRRTVRLCLCVYTCFEQRHRSVFVRNLISRKMFVGNYFQYSYSPRPSITCARIYGWSASAVAARHVT